MKLFSTRDTKDSVEFSEALLNPSAAFGGLYAPEILPVCDKKFWQESENSSYRDFALKVIEKFGFDISGEIFAEALKRYENFDDQKCPVKFTKFSENCEILELYHGPTRAFKDMALQPFGEILSKIAVSRKENYLIMCATSGDTGPATLQTFANAKNTRVICLYPKNGTSEVQRLQMVNVDAKNLKTIGIKGNFDDAQRALKNLLADNEFKDELAANGLKLSAANSVNFGRILFQIIYYLFANLHFKGQNFNVIVPSGNFGNALGAYYAKKMGANIEDICIASNANNVLTELFTKGIYDLRKRSLIKTMSPAMDILISSNVERLLFDKFGDIRTRELMKDLKENRFYRLTDDELKELKNDFKAGFSNDEECSEIIKKVSEKGILIDPHTANCFKLINENEKNLIVSTAEWLKFTPSMVKAINGGMKSDEKSEMNALAEKFNVKIPKSISLLFERSEIHKDIAEQNEIKNKIIEWIKK